jgi:hypothetical protein
LKIAFWTQVSNLPGEKKTSRMFRSSVTFCAAGRASENLQRACRRGSAGIPVVGPALLDGLERRIPESKVERIAVP